MTRHAQTPEDARAGQAEHVGAESGDKATLADARADAADARADVSEAVAAHSGDAIAALTVVAAQQNRNIEALSEALTKLTGAVSNRPTRREAFNLSARVTLVAMALILLGVGAMFLDLRDVSRANGQDRRQLNRLVSFVDDLESQPPEAGSVSNAELRQVFETVYEMRDLLCTLTPCPPRP